MTGAAQAALKIQQLMVENQQIAANIQAIQTDYDVLTDQYMDGRITWNIGGAQRRMERQVEKLRRRAEKNSDTIWKLKVKFGL